MHFLAGVAPRGPNARVVRVDPGVHGYDTARFQDAVELFDAVGGVVSEVNESAGKSVRDAVGGDVLDSLV